jgi:hypothetical protein
MKSFPWFTEEVPGWVKNVVYILTLLVGFHFYVDSRVTSKLNNDEFIKKIAEKLRPAVIFDQNETILSNMGALAHIENITVKGVVAKLSVGEVKRPTEIIISSKEFLPICSSLIN